MSLLSELKRRNVFRVAVAYLALGWLVIQVTDTLAPAFHFPDFVLPLVTWIGVIGFPFAVVFAWVYELTPEGLKRESEVDRSRSITHVTGKRLDYVTIALLVVAIGLLLADRFLVGDAPPATAPPLAQGLAEADDAADPSSDESPPVIVSIPEEKSIAVLPFADMSAEKNQGYMADGMAEELLNLLAKAPDLKVIARTSSFAFKGEKVGIPEIAKKLNVSHVLEGSVRTSGNKLRITAQLIRASDSAHVWSETYDRSFDDIFAVQDEIAGAIAQALQIKFMGGKLTRREGGTQNLEAYQLYLRGVSAMKQNTKSSLEAARAYFEEATKLDPGYGAAWSGFANYFSLMADNGFLDAREGYGQARRLAEHSLRLSPDLADSYWILQYIYQALDWDWAAAEAEAKKALALYPGNTGALLGLGVLSRTLGRYDDAEQYLRDALVRDPLGPYLIWNLGTIYYLSGRFDDSEAMYLKLLEVSPEFRWTRAYLGKALLAQGKSTAAVAVVEQDPDEASRLWFLPVFLQGDGRIPEAEEALRAQIEHLADDCAYCIAQTYAYRGEHDLAMEWLERAYSQRDAGLVEIVGEPLFKGMIDDPRYQAFLRKMNLPVHPGES